MVRAYQTDEIYAQRQQVRNQRGAAGLSKHDAMKAMRGRVIAEGEVVGTYKRAA